MMVWNDRINGSRFRWDAENKITRKEWIHISNDIHDIHYEVIASSLYGSLPMYDVEEEDDSETSRHSEPGETL